MANTKISALPAAAPLSGTEPLPTVQAGITSKTLISAIATYFRTLVNSFAKNQSVTFSTLTSGSSVSVNAALSNNFYLSLAHNATIENPTNLTDGMVLNFLIKQTGTFTCAFGSKFRFAGGDPTISNVANKVDLVSGVYHESLDIIACGIAQDLS